MSPKRKSVEEKFNRNVKVRRESSEELEYSHLSSETIEDSQIEDGETVSDDEKSSRHLNSDFDADTLASITFGALARVQTSLTHPLVRKTASRSSGKNSKQNQETENFHRLEKKICFDFHRPNTHAPTEMSSKKAVSRRRDVVSTKKRKARDPRFEPLNSPTQAPKLTRAYEFLDEYQENEMKELKLAIQTTKDIDAKEKLKKAFSAMESRKKAKIKKLKEREILDRHRKHEKILVRQGKKPFYLKKAEQKKQILINQFSELKSKQLDRIIQRRRKKIESKQKKKLTFTRRT